MTHRTQTNRYLALMTWSCSTRAISQAVTSYPCHVPLGEVAADLHLPTSTFPPLSHVQTLTPRHAGTCLKSTQC
jgi:hypothetical protein